MISQFHIDICSKTLWVNTESGAREKAFELTLQTAHMPPGEAGQFGHWRNVSWLLKHEQSNSLGLCCCVSQRTTTWGRRSVYCLLCISHEHSASLLIFFSHTVLQEIREIYTTSSKKWKKKCAPFENKVQAFIFYFISHIYYYLWFFSPLCLCLEACAVSLRGSLNWNWTYRHHTDVEKIYKSM